MARGAELAAGIICGSLGNTENAQLQSAFEHKGGRAVQILPEDVAIGVSLGDNFLHEKERIDSLPGFVVRGIGFTTFSRSFFRMDVLYALEQRGKILINKARSTETAMNKALASVALDAAGIPTPATLVTENLKHALTAFDALGGDVLIKPVYGSQGVGIFRIQDKGLAENVFLELFRNGHVFYIQAFHPWSAPPGIAISRPFDVRLVVVGDEIAGAMIRESPAIDQWKTNIHQGAIPRPYSPSKEVRDLALASTKALGLEVAGIDLLHSARTGGWIVLEANCAPGWTGLSKASNADIPATIVEYYRRKLKQ
jgi:RimK family alpha-L-glutamate ligase